MMNAADALLLNLTRLPGRLSVERAAVLLGFDVEDLTILMNHRLLMPIGIPARNAQKFFYPDYVEALVRDKKWIARATMCIYKNTREKNRLKALRKEQRKAELRGQAFTKNVQNSGG